MSQILIEEAVTPIGKKYSGLPSLKTFIKKRDSLIHCDLRKGLLLKFNVYKVARMLQIKRLKFITKCSLRDPGAKSKAQGSDDDEGKTKTKTRTKRKFTATSGRRNEGKLVLIYQASNFPLFHPPPLKL